MVRRRSYSKHQLPTFQKELVQPHVAGRGLGTIDKFTRLVDKFTRLVAASGAGIALLLAELLLQFADQPELSSRTKLRIWCLIRPLGWDVC